MTSAGGINNFSAGANVPYTPPQPQASSINSVTSKPITPQKIEGISPRLVVDPQVGAIIQYLSGTGQVQLQIPSVTAVAYLKAGLTPDGFAKPLPNSPHAGGNSTIA